MKWSRRLCALVLVCTLIFSLGQTAAAATNDEVKAAISRMQAIGIVQGRDDGDLALTATITRAELMTILVRAFGQESSAPLLQGAPTFSDTTSHWASGYVALAHNIVQQSSNGQHGLGFPDGSFKPDEPVTAAETVTFLMKFLGVKPASTGEWPFNYLQGALAADLITAADLSHIQAGLTEPATRGLAFYLADSSFYGYKLGDGKTVYTKHGDEPVLKIDVLPATTSARQITITGTVSPHPKEVRVGGALAALDGERFSATVPLIEGTNKIKVEAVNIAGNSAVETVHVIWQPVYHPVPTISLNPKVTAANCKSAFNQEDYDIVEVTCTGSVSSEAEHVLAWIPDGGRLCSGSGFPCLKSAAVDNGTFTIQFFFENPESVSLTVKFVASSRWGTMSDIVTRAVELPDPEQID